MPRKMLTLVKTMQHLKSQSTLSDETLEERISFKTGVLELPSENKAQTERDTSQVGKNKKTGMVLPFEPLSITFSVIYFVDMPQEMKSVQKMKSEGVSKDRLQLLRGVSGSFRPGVLTALMGVRGAGKTTLMDVLAGRKTSGYIEGTIKISGYLKKQKTFARVSVKGQRN